jgi:hypothetical protein
VIRQRTSALAYARVAPRPQATVAPPLAAPSLFPRFRALPLGPRRSTRALPSPDQAAAVGGAAWAQTLVKLLPFGVGATLLVLWIRYIVDIHSGYGVFNWLGVDFGYYYGQALALRSGDPVLIYDRLTVDHFHQLLIGYVHDPTGFPVGHVPYLPIFAWLFGPVTLLPPLVGLALWTVFNLLGAVLLTRRIASLLPAGSRPWVYVLSLGSLPFMSTLIVGQPMLWLSLGFAECYLALRRGQDFRAGMWLALLLLKPQYGIIIGPLLLWKRRWNAVAGVGVGAIVMLGGSLLVSNVQTLLAYPMSIVAEGSGYRGGQAGTSPEVMINWRSLLLRLLPGVDEVTGVVLTLSLSVATIGVVLLSWRGRWDAGSDRFPLLMLMVMVATLLASYHSHLPGAVLLAIPVAAVLGGRQASWPTRTLILIAVALPSITLVVFGLTSIRLFTGLLCLTLATLLYDAWSVRFDFRTWAPWQAALRSRVVQVLRSRGPLALAGVTSMVRSPR